MTVKNKIHSLNLLYGNLFLHSEQVSQTREEEEKTKRLNQLEEYSK